MEDSRSFNRNIIYTLTNDKVHLAIARKIDEITVKYVVGFKAVENKKYSRVAKYTEIEDALSHIEKMAEAARHPNFKIQAS